MRKSRKAVVLPVQAAMLMVAAWTGGCGENSPGVSAADAGTSGDAIGRDARPSDSLHAETELPADASDALLDRPILDDASLDAAVDAATDAPMQCDASPCTWGHDSAASPTHVPLVAYDSYLYYASNGMAPDRPVEVFVDEAGLAVFGRLRFVRATTDGALVGETAYPTGPFFAPVVPFAVAQSPAGFGAVVVGAYSPMTSDEPSFCVFTPAGTTDIYGCAPLQHVGNNAAEIAWSGAEYRVLGQIDAVTSYVASYDLAGSLVGVQHLPAELLVMAPVFVGGNLIGVSLGPHDANCQTEYLQILPPAFDPTTVQRWDTLPADFQVCCGNPVSAGGETYAAVVTMGWCWKRQVCPPPASQYGDCSSMWLTPFPPLATTLSIAGADGQPVVLGQRMPTSQQLPQEPQVLWDGASFVYVDRSHERPSGSDGIDFWMLYTYDPDGILTRVARLDLRVSRPPHTLYGGRLVALAPNDYAMVYTFSDNWETWIARFMLVAM